MSDSETNEEGTLQIEDKSTDSDGNVWYKIFGTITKGYFKGDKYQQLTKISQSGNVSETVLEFIGKHDFDPARYPTKVDPKAPTYSISYRVKE